MKPILFKTEMVRAILEGRKTVTRRVVKMRGLTPDEIGRKDYCGMINGLNDKDGLFAGFYKDSDIFTVDGITHIDAEYAKSAYLPGDVLYVRETWNRGYIDSSDAELSNEHWFEEYHKRDGSYLDGISRYVYRADITRAEEYELGTLDEDNALRPMPWHPSIHMPKEAARIFLKVTDVRIERLQEIKSNECVAEGAVKRPDYTKRHDLVLHNRYRQEFAELWDSTVKPADLDRYGWAANPWVWVISFERCEKTGEGEENRI